MSCDIHAIYAIYMRYPRYARDICDIQAIYAIYARYTRYTARCTRYTRYARYTPISAIYTRYKTEKLKSAKSAKCGPVYRYQSNSKQALLGCSKLIVVHGTSPLHLCPVFLKPLIVYNLSAVQTNIKNEYQGIMAAVNYSVLFVRNPGASSVKSSIVGVRQK